MNNCSNCGAALPAGAKFCINCGTPVEGQSAQQVVVDPTNPVIPTTQPAVKGKTLAGGYCVSQNQ